MRALQEVLVNLVLHELLQRVSDALHFGLLHFCRWLNVKVLLFPSKLELLSLQDQRGNVLFAVSGSLVGRACPVAAIWVVSVLELV